MAKKHVVVGSMVTEMYDIDADDDEKAMEQAAEMLDQRLHEAGLNHMPFMANVVPDEVADQIRPPKEQMV